MVSLFSFLLNVPVRYVVIHRLFWSEMRCVFSRFYMDRIVEHGYLMIEILTVENLMSSFPVLLKSLAVSMPDDASWDEARDRAYALASTADEDPMLMSWFDQKTGKFSPSCCQCDLTDGAAWEVYGRNHGGRLRISINNDRFVFIYT